MPITKAQKKTILTLCLSGVLLLGGCGTEITFEKIDRKGHVRIEREGAGYCFRVPTDWEIRENLEEADVVCLAPLEGGFRDSVVARTLPASEIVEPEELVLRQLESLGPKAIILEPWTGLDKPVVVSLQEARFTKETLGQLLFIHKRSDGAGVLITCTTTKDRLAERREFFEEIVAKAEYDLSKCLAPGGLPEVFPTPSVTLRP